MKFPMGDMASRYYLYQIAEPGTFRRELAIVTADGDQEAKELLEKERGTKAFSADRLGFVSREDMLDMVIPEPRRKDPVGLIGSVKYLYAEYGDMLGKADRMALKRIENKLVNHFFN